MWFRRRRSSRPPPGEYPPSFTHAWIRRTLPTASAREAQGLLQRMRDRGWTEAEIAERILPYMPRIPPSAASDEAPGGGGIPVPADVSTDWLDRHLPAMDREQIRLVVEELERRGWPTTKVTFTVLPHLLPKLPPEDAKAILTELEALGLSQEEIARLAPDDGSTYSGS